MAIRHQKKDDKHPYESPTTPGEYVTFRSFIIELVCCNNNPKLGPRFWSDQKYWAPKYRRETRGVANLAKEFCFDDAITRTALVQIIQDHRIKALVAKKTLTKVIRLTKKRIEELTSHRQNLAKKVHSEPIDCKKNATFVDTGAPNAISRIRAAENG